MDTYDFTLHDATGGVHKYTVAPHSSTPGQAIMIELMAMLADPLVSAVGSFFTSGVSVSEFMDSPAGMEALDGLDLGQAGPRIAHQLRTTDTAALVRAILANTFRDGEPLFALNGINNFDVAYSRNYAEMISAVIEVVKLNRFLSLASISWGG